jgi:hypothetical protein
MLPTFQLLASGSVLSVNAAEMIHADMSGSLVLVLSLVNKAAVVLEQYQTACCVLGITN